MSEVPARLRDAGFRNVSKYSDVIDLRRLGLRIELAQYVGGVQKTGRFINVMVVS